MATSPFAVAAGVALFAFVGGLVGFFLQHRLPKHHTTERSRDMIGAVNSLVSLILALVLGTLIGSGYSFFYTQKTELETLSARAVEIDLGLREFGPEAQSARAKLKEDLQGAYDTYWSGKVATLQEIGVVAPSLKIAEMKTLLAALEPQTQLQKDALADAKAQVSAFADTRIHMAMQLVRPQAWPLVVIIAAWAGFLFMGHGLMSQFSVMTVSVLTLGSLAVGSALFLILEIRDPYSGVIRLPPDSLLAAIDAIGK
jgi:hypothetical protein